MKHKFSYLIYTNEMSLEKLICIGKSIIDNALIFDFAPEVDRIVPHEQFEIKQDNRCQDLKKTI